MPRSILRSPLTRDRGGSRSSNFYYSFLFLPREKRSAILTLYEFCRRTDDIIDNSSSEAEKRDALQAWRERVRKALDGASTDRSLIELGSVAVRYAIPSALFMELIDGVEMDLTHLRYQTFDDLYPYCYRVGSTVGLMTIEIFGYQTAGAKQYATNLGVALQLTNILRDLHADAEQGRVYVPQQDFDAAGYSMAELQRQTVNASFRRLIQLECERARGFFLAARGCLGKGDLRSLYPAEAMASIYERLLTRIERRPSEIFQRVVGLPLPVKFGIAMKTWAEHAVWSTNEQ
jgi:phytoene synthase